MTMIQHKSGLGFDVVPRVFNVVVRGGDASQGDVMMFDMGNTDASVFNNVPGARDSGFVSVIPPNAAGVQGGSILCVLMQDISDDESGIAWTVGIIDNVYVIDGADSVAIGDLLVATTSKNCDAVTAQGERYIGIAMEAQTTPSTRTLSKVWFNGEGGGFGTDGTA